MRVARRLLPTVAVALGCAGVAHASPVPSGPGSGHRALVQQAAAVPASASVDGALPPSEPVQITLALAPPDPQALSAYAQDVSDPGSSLYRHYLSVSQFATQFGADGTELSTVRAALTQAGLTVDAVGADGLSLSASGSAEEVEGAFDTELEALTLAHGQVAYADVTDPTLPIAAADAVQSVAGLDSLPAAAPAGLARAGRGASAAQAHAVSRAAGPGSCIASQVADGYTAAEIGSAYGMDSEWDAGDLGAGTSVGLAELEPYHRADVTAFQACDGTNATVTNTQIGNGASCDAGGVYDSDCGLEDVLDIEDIAGLVPDADIDVYEAPNTDLGLLDMYQAMVTADLPVISTSWGLCEASTESSDPAMLGAENSIFQEAAVQGEAVFAAAGDDGADDCINGTRAVDDPASQPFVTGVGGTTMTSDSPGSTETVWNDASGASGGGVSREWAQPSYQSGIALTQSSINCASSPGAAASSTTCREVPDVAADADPDTGYDIDWDGQWIEAGGTSAAAPTWASLAALADGSSACASAGVRVGFANELLYGLPASAFNDVTSGNNSADGVNGYAAQAGYDMASGRGAPNGAVLLPALCDTSMTITASTTTTSTTATATPPTPTPTPPAPVQTATTTTTTSTPTIEPSRGGGVDVVRFVPGAGHRTLRLGRRVHIVIRARDRDGLRVRYSARRLPRGLRINASTGVITGAPTRLGRNLSRITARDSRGDAETIVVRFLVTRG